MPDIEDGKRHRMASSGPKKGSSTPGWVRTAKFIAVMATILVLLGATDLPGSGSVKRLAAASGLTMYADDPGAPFPRLERRSLFAQSSSAKVPNTFSTKERPKLTPEEEERRKQIIKIYEEAKEEAAKEQERKVARDAEREKQVEASRAKEKAQKEAARKELARAKGDAKGEKDSAARSNSGDEKKADRKDDDRKRESRDEGDSKDKKDAGQQKGRDADKAAAEKKDDKAAKKDTA